MIDGTGRGRVLARGHTGLEQHAGAAVRGVRRCAAGLAVVVTALYTAVLPASAPAAGAPAAPPKSPAEAHYTPAPCRTAETSNRNGHFARCFAMVQTAVDHEIRGDPHGPPPTALGPADIQAAYGLPAAGQGQLVGIVDAFGDSHAQSDLARFRSFYGLPPCTTANGCFRKTDQNGGTDYPIDDPGWGLETSLDLDAVSAACPACKILLVEGDDNSVDNLGIAVDTAVNLGAKYVSNSYGVPGDFASETAFDHYYNHQGVAVTASTGDTGDLTNWPATNPNVIAVGGTTLTRDTGTGRGWTETAWTDGGSGCSPVEPRPDYQDGLTTGCTNRAIADLSADADPATGLAVYDTLGEGGWLPVGGTSLSSPLIAAMYALAGTPVPGTYPVTYPYRRPSALHDVTHGSNGSCGDVLCNAGPGWDGPTGLGTPNGVGALTTGPHGQLIGTVTDAQTHAPLAGATVSGGVDYSATTDSAGHYGMSVPVGTYDVTARAFGYRSVVHTGLAVTRNDATRTNFALVSAPSKTLSGVITDGSGHHWPLYAKLTIDGFPGGAIYSDPYTGHYRVQLPQNRTYTLHVTPQLPGYQRPVVHVRIDSADVNRNLAVSVNASSCDAPGYSVLNDGIVEQFTGWTGTTPQDGWRNVDREGNGQIWSFDDPGSRPPPGGDSDFAIIDSDNYGPGNTQDTSLLSPTFDLSTVATPEVGFDTEYRGISAQTADVDVSVDNGSTWTNVWHRDTESVTGHVDVSLPMTAHRAGVKVRFHFTGSFGWWWSVDNVFIGTRSCVPTTGGLLAGVVTDANTHTGLVGARVSSVARPNQFGITTATPNDANLPDGFYEFFSSLTGARQFTAVSGRYRAATAMVTLAPNWVTQKNWSLRAGRLTVSPLSISTTEILGQSRTADLTFGNAGSEPVQVTLSEQTGAFTPAAGQDAGSSGAPLTLISGTFSPAAAIARDRTGARAPGGPQLRAAAPSAGPWQDLADYPTPTMDNAVGYDDGKVYSVAGSDGEQALAGGYVYDPSSRRWMPIADAPAALEAPAGAFLHGKFYLVGGWDSNGAASTGVYAYDPTADSWTRAASLPKALSAAAIAVLDDQLYVIGGCTTVECAPTSAAVYRYDLGHNRWTRLADYPTPQAFLACAGIVGEVVCAGGVNADTDASSKATYRYDPGTDTWTQGAHLPYDNWGMAYAGANNQLEVAAGVTDDSATVTNQAAAYDPSRNAWTALPNANDAEYRGGGSCGFYKVGGSTGGFSPIRFAEVLPGHDECGGGTDVSWLSEVPTQFTVAPGQHITVTVTMDSSVVSQPGTYPAKILFGNDSPYQLAPVPVSMTVNPPSAWGKVAGTVTDAGTGKPVPGATVQVCTMYDPRTGTCGPVTYTLRTDSSGYYQLWLNHGYNPLQIIAAKDGYQPQEKTVRITQGTTTTVNFALRGA
jgi:N-acetylneuraminic acid mutarotase